MVIDMVKNLEIFVVLVILFIGVFFIFNARAVFKKKAEKMKKDENKVVNLVKILAYVVSILALGMLYILIRK